METNNLNLKKFNLEAEANDTMNVETYFNNNWDKIDEKVGSMSGLATDEKDSLTGAINELKQRADDNRDAMEKSETVAFEMDGAVGSYPEGSKGLFTPKVEGVRPIYQAMRKTDIWKRVTVDGNVLKVSDDPIHNTNRQMASYLKSGDKLFFFLKARKTVRTKVYDGTHYQTSVNTAALNDNTFTEQYASLVITKPNTYTHISLSAGAEVMDDIMFINMTQNGISNYTDEQMLAICRQGYWEGMKTCAQNYELISRGVNKFDDILEDGNLRASDGMEVDQIDRKRTGYIAVKNSTNYTTDVKVNVFIYDNNYNLLFYELGVVSFNTGDGNKIRLCGGASNMDALVSLMEDSTPPTSYAPYIESKTEFSVPEEYPLVELPNSTKNYIDANGHYVGNIRAQVLTESAFDKTMRINGIKADYIMIKKESLIDSVDLVNNELGSFIIESYQETTVSGWDNSDNIGKFFVFSQGNSLCVLFKKGTSFEDAQAALIGKRIYYQLAEPITFAHGEQGYNTPTSLQSLQNGDLVVSGLYSKVHDCNSKIITLDQPLLKIKISTALVGGEYRELDVKMIDERTIELTDSYIGKVLIEGELKGTSYLYPKVCGNISKNISGMVNANEEASINATEKISLMKKKQDLLIANNLKLNKESRISFNTVGAMKGYPEGVNGLFSPKVKGMQPLLNLVPSNVIPEKNLKHTNPEAGGDYIGVALGSVIPTKGTYFIRTRMRATGKGLAQLFIMLGDGASNRWYGNITEPTENKWYEVYGVVRPREVSTIENMSFRVYATYDDNAKAKAGSIEIDKNHHSFVVPMDSNYTEAQVLDICRQGYWEGLKTPAQNYELVSRGVNKFDSTKIILDGKRIHEGNGGLIQGLPISNAGDGHSTYIHIKPNTAYKLNGANSVSYSTWAVYDSNKLFIRGGTAKNFTITSPSNAHYIRISVHSEDLCTLMLIEDHGHTLAGYKSSFISQTEFSIQIDYPLVELPNGAKNYVNNNGDYVVNVKRHKLQESDLTYLYTENDEVDIARMQLSTLGLPGKYISSKYGENMVASIPKLTGVSMRNIAQTDVGKVATNSGSSFLDFIVKKGTTLEQAMALLAGTEIYYQLAQPRIFKDGENGYKAPSSIEAFENGDLVVTGLYSKVHTCNGKTITLDQPIISLKNVYAEVDGEYKELDATLTNETTVTLKEAFNGEVLVKGQLDPKCYINPKITADIPANLGTLASSNSKAISHTNEKLISLQDKLDLLMVMNS